MGFLQVMTKSWRDGDKRTPEADSATPKRHGKYGLTYGSENFFVELYNHLLRSNFNLKKSDGRNNHTIRSRTISFTYFQVTATANIFTFFISYYPFRSILLLLSLISVEINLRTPSRVIQIPTSRPPDGIAHTLNDLGSSAEMKGVLWPRQLHHRRRIIQNVSVGTITDMAHIASQQIETM